jgi:hypothetical protein
MPGTVINNRQVGSAFTRPLDSDVEDGDLLAQLSPGGQKRMSQSCG